MLVPILFSYAQNMSAFQNWNKLYEDFFSKNCLSALRTYYFFLWYTAEYFSCGFFSSLWTIFVLSHYNSAYNLLL